LELIAVQDRAAAWQELVRHLEQHGPGLFTFAFATDDLDADVAQLKSRAVSGVTTSPDSGAHRPGCGSGGLLFDGSGNTVHPFSRFRRRAD